MDGSVRARSGDGDLAARAGVRTVVGILDETGVPYMLTGSLAAAYYATPRATQDVDVVIDVENDDVQP